MSDKSRSSVSEGEEEVSNYSNNDSILQNKLNFVLKSQLKNVFL
jgi:hypothetical protein